MQIQQLAPYSLENIPTGQFFSRSNMIRLSPSTSNRSIAEIEGTKAGLWKTTYTFLVSETKERFCHCVTLVHDAYSFENAMKDTETYYVNDDMFVINRSKPLGFRDSQHYSIKQLLVLKADIEFINSGTFSGVFTGGTFFNTFGHGECYASLLVSSNEDGEIYMVQLVLPIPDQFLINEKHDLIDIVKNLPLGKVVDPMHMTHAMKIIESEGWLIEQDKADEYRISKFSPAGQDFSIVMQGTTDSEFAASIYDAYQAFDPSTEAYQWLDESVHGTNGAPHDMLDVITDMNYCKDEIYRLYQAVTHR